jgi:hypothetical protein
MIRRNPVRRANNYVISIVFKIHVRSLLLQLRNLCLLLIMVLALMNTAFNAAPVEVARQIAVPVLDDGKDVIVENATTAPDQPWWNVFWGF